MSLIVCTACQRHVRAGEGGCPFCGAEVSARAAPARPILGRLGRASLFAIGATMTVTAAGCSTGPLYGGPPPDAGPEVQDAGETVAPLYGGPPQDAGAQVEDAGETVAPLYGGAPGD